MDFACEVYGPALSITKRNELERRVQSYALYRFTNTKAYDGRTKKVTHITPILERNGIEPLEERQAQLIARMIHKDFYGIVPSFLIGIDKRKESRCYNELCQVQNCQLISHTQGPLLAMTTASKKIEEQSLSYVGPRIWNSIPKEIRCCVGSNPNACYKTNLKRFVCHVNSLNLASLAKRPTNEIINPRAKREDDNFVT